MLIVPETITPDIDAFACELCDGSEVMRIPVRPDAAAIDLSCWQNVTSVLDRNGGAPVKGWRLWWIPDILIEAQAHAVWQTPDGDLIDVTPNEDGEQACLFVRDDSMSVDPGVDYVASKHKNLCGEPVVDEYIRCTNVVSEHIDRQKTSGHWFPDPPEQQQLRHSLEQIRRLVENPKNDK